MPRLKLCDVHYTVVDTHDLLLGCGCPCRTLADPPTSLPSPALEVSSLSHRTKFLFPRWRGATIIKKITWFESEQLSTLPPK